MKASRLLWLEGAGGCPLHGRTFPLAFGKELTFGRCCDADYPLPYRHINRWQFEVAWRGCGLRVRPLQAHRATLLNGRPLPADWTRMRSGDLLIAGEARLRVVAAAQPASVRVLSIVRAIQEGGDYAALPVLADALEEEGLAAPEVLQHCREAGHDAGCWVLGLAWAGPVTDCPGQGGDEGERDGG